MKDEIEQLDLSDIDIEELERRIEMTDISPGGFYCSCDNGNNPRPPTPQKPAPCGC